ncbi:hypothetical protein NDA14_002526 [Ustilago hordei]|uniref:Uncharacterized protein n=1 Tax=Ustilago hordei TaxID=120017 RepID=I2FVN7_USTHO|nr:hypothetical protein NDA14_002526 [Ustilago hordei]CCF50980.1 uncharacterized protein UHOR_14718 [Ustilago hordei]
MAELVKIGSSNTLLQNPLGSVVPCLYNRSHGNQLGDTSITDPTIRGQQARNGLPPDEAGALHYNELGARRWVLSEVTDPKPDICNRIVSIMNSIEICDNTCGITILGEICSRDISITFLAQRCSNGFAIAGFD